MHSIELIASGANVAPIVDAIAANPHLWNEHKARTAIYQHSQVSDIWVRYNDFANFDGDLAKFNEPHESVWYPSADLLLVKPLIFDLMHFVRGERLGGVLITKIPPRGEVKPHVDGGWHAGYYDKFAVQLASNDRQAFCFEDARLVTNPGDLYTFHNDRLHWVTNDSDEDRMTLIVCIRRSR